MPSCFISMILLWRKTCKGLSLFMHEFFICVVESWRDHYIQTTQSFKPSHCIWLSDREWDCLNSTERLRSTNFGTWYCCNPHIIYKEYILFLPWLPLPYMYLPMIPKVAHHLFLHLLSWIYVTLPNLICE